MKIISILKDKLSDTMAGLIVLVIKEALLRFLFPLLQKKHEKHFHVTLVSLYPIIDVELEELVKGTETEYDDAFVKAIKESMEEYAKENELQLPNLDDD